MTSCHNVVKQGRIRTEIGSMAILTDWVEGRSSGWSSGSVGTIVFSWLVSKIRFLGGGRLNFLCGVLAAISVGVKKYTGWRSSSVGSPLIPYCLDPWFTGSFLWRELEPIHCGHISPFYYSAGVTNIVIASPNATPLMTFHVTFHVRKMLCSL